MKYVLSLLLLFSFNARAQIQLNDLGITPEQIESTPSSLTPAEAKERTWKLKKHEMWGLATFGLMTATMFTGGSALDSNTHMYLGFATAASYATTAYLSLTAPKPMGVVDKGRIKWHKGLAWVHLPLMILVPYLGYQYKKNEENGKKHSALEKNHSAFAGVMYGTFALSTALMVIEF